MAKIIVSHSMPVYMLFMRQHQVLQSEMPESDEPLESAVPTAAVRIVEETISQIALTPTIRQHPIITCSVHPSDSELASVFPNITISALIKNKVFRNAEKNPVTAQDTYTFVFLLIRSENISDQKSVKNTWYKTLNCT